jgi:hypothetical protein
VHVTGTRNFRNFRKRYANQGLKGIPWLRQQTAGHILEQGSCKEFPPVSATPSGVHRPPTIDYWWGFRPFRPFRRRFSVWAGIFRIFRYLR